MSSFLAMFEGQPDSKITGLAMAVHDLKDIWRSSPARRSFCVVAS